MRPPHLRPLFACATVALSTWLASCQRADSILLVEVAGDLKLMPAGFAVTVAPRQMAARDIRVAPHAGGAISLPASFTIQLPGNATGPVTVGVDALDASGTVIAHGSATQRNLNVGGQTILPIAMVATGSIAVTTPPDGGAADAHPTADAHPVGDAQPPADAGAGVDARADAPVRDAAALDGGRAVDGAAGAGGQS